MRTVLNAHGGKRSRRLTGQAMGALMMTLLFTIAPDGDASRIGLAIGSSVALMAGW